MVAPFANLVPEITLRHPKRPAGEKNKKVTPVATGHFSISVFVSLFIAKPDK